MIDTSTINVWLALIAIATVLQTLFLFGVAFMAWRATKQVTQAVNRFEQQHLEPLMSRVNGAVDDVRDMAARARALDDGVRDKVTSATEHARDAAELVAERIWPAYAVGKAAYTAVSSFLSGRRAAHR